MIRTLTTCLLLLVPAGFAGCSGQPTSPSPLPAVTGLPPATATAAQGGRAATTVVIFVRSQGLYFDSIIVRDPIRMQGPFQLLENGETEFGPGDPGYVGGRWWEDLNKNGVQDSGDHFFLCPLLPPGRSAP